MLDTLNQQYFEALHKKARTHTSTRKIRIDFGESTPSDVTRAYPSAIAPPELLRRLPVTEYDDLLSQGEKLRAHARETTLWIKKMHAGTGSSVERTQYLAKIRGVPPEKVRIGAKSTDLYAEIAGEGPVSLAELQIRQAIHDLPDFKSIVLHDIVSSETQDSIADLWKTRSLEATPGLKRSGKTVQALIPTLDEARELSTRRMAPGGHALFAVEAILDALDYDKIPAHDTVCAIGNGEDLSSTPDALMVGFMREKKIPIAMVTTDKTSIDLKGGQIALAIAPDGEVYCTIIEQAQAKEAGQLELFEKIGLEIKNGEQKAFFNTNMALFNYAVLIPKLQKLQAILGAEKFMDAIAPDLIANWKEQTDDDGVKRKYLQMEGAMGSSLLNLDRAWRKHFGELEPLVHFINVSRKRRTQFFSPIKTAFDFFMQFHSDRFRLDPVSARLKNLRPGELPSVTLKDSAHQSVHHVLQDFAGVSILELDSLELEKRGSLGGQKLVGAVKA